MLALKHYNIWLQCIEKSLEILKMYNFKKPIDGYGWVLYNYVDEKIGKITIPEDIRARIWFQVVSNYRNRNKDYPLLVNSDLRENITCIHIFKGELIRWYIQNNLELQNKLWPKE